MKGGVTIHLAQVFLAAMKETPHGFFSPLQSISALLKSFSRS